MSSLCAISVVLGSVLVFNMMGQCEMSLYPGLRRKPAQQSLQYEEPEQNLMSQLMEENARRRLLQQFDHQLGLIRLKLERQRAAEQERYLQQQKERQRQWLEAMAAAENDEDFQEMDMEGDDDEADSEAMAGEGGSRLYANRKFDEILRYKPIQFGVPPTDPRYYMDPVAPPSAAAFDTDGVDGESADELDDKTRAEYEEYKPVEGKDKEVTVQNGPNDKSVVLSPVESAKQGDAAAAAAATTFHRIKPQTAAAAAVAGVNLGGEDGANKLHMMESVVTGDPLGQHIVVRQHLPGMDNEMGIYVVALLAGISAAVTVGIIGLGIAWLHSRNKSAADVDYPAYGITGPNKDISPSGDRKLAQSAQMFHYQHQKQQIIAMENRQADGSCGNLSDVESDEEEEGDYTVYECPGLAPTGEMEVKNPLFLDETPMTPATGATAAAVAGAVAPANIVTQVQAAQPPTQKQGKHGKASTVNSTAGVTTTVTSSNEKPNKKSKK